MRILRAAFDFYLYSNLHMSLCAVALTANTAIILHHTVPIYIYLYIWAATFFLYNVQRLYASFRLQTIERQDSARHIWLNTNQVLMSTLTLMSVAVGLWAMYLWYADLDHNWFRLTKALKGIIIIPAIISLAYALPFIPWKGRWLRLRDVPFVKIFLIAFVWTWVTVLIPFLTSKHQTGALMHESYAWTNLLGYTLMLISGLYILALTIPFDIRDIRIDGQQLKVLPALLGIQRSKYVAICLLLLCPIVFFCATHFFAAETIHWLPFQIAIAAWAIVASITVSFATPLRHEYYFSFLVDGLLILLWIFIVIAQQVESLAT